MTEVVIGSSSTTFGAASASWGATSTNEGWQVPEGNPSISVGLQDNTNLTYSYRQTDGDNVLELEVDIEDEAIPDEAEITSVEWAVIYRIDGAGDSIVDATRDGVTQGLLDPTATSTFTEAYFILEEVMTGAQFNSSGWGFATNFDAGMSPVQVAEFALRVTYTSGPPPETTVETLPATQIESSSAYINGHLEPNATPEEPVIYFFTWGFDLLLSSSTKLQIATDDTPIDYSIQLTDLPRGTTVYFRFEAANLEEPETEPIFGETLSFDTGGDNEIVVSL